MSVQVAVIMGSTSDWDTMQHACAVLDELEIGYEKKVVSAHRTPDLMFRFAEEAVGRGLKVIIAGAGGAAHLPGMVAFQDDIASHRCACPVEGAERSGFLALHCADAGRHSGRYCSNW